MSWHYSRALEAAYSAANSSDGRPSAQSKSTTTHEASCSPDRTTDASNPSQCGTTCEPSTGARGAELLTWYLAASHARTSARPTPTPQVSPVSEADCGGKWRESSVKFDRATSSWKTHRCLWEEDLDWSSVTWPQWGMMRAGVLWERGTPERLTSATASGCWPTPNCSNDRSPCLHDAKKAWVGEPRENGDKVQARLQDAAAFWPTPRASDGDRGGRGDLVQAVRGNENKHFKLWPTPKANDAEKRGNFDVNNPRNGLAAAARQENPTGGKLNPAWVEWLMGWPISWTESAPLETAKFQQWCRSHGIS